MLKLETERLTLIPLDEDNLTLAIENFNALEAKLNLTITEKNIGVRENAVFKLRLANVKNNPDNYMWFTTWIIILKEKNRIVGHIMLKNYPDENGESIIGYAMQEDYRRKGYMSEALRALVIFMFRNAKLKRITADTLKDNKASQNTLKKIGMSFYMEDDECFWWKLDRPSTLS